MQARGAVMQSPATLQLQSRRAMPLVRCSGATAAGGAAPQPPSLPLLRLTALAAGAVAAARRSLAAASADAARAAAEQDINGQIRQSVKQMRMLALVAPFAAVSGSTDTFMIITRAVASFIKLYLLLLFVRVLLSWFPTFEWWEQQPFSALRQVRGGARGGRPAAGGGEGRTRAAGEQAQLHAW